MPLHLGRLWKDSLQGVKVLHLLANHAGVCSQIKSSEDMLAGHRHASLIKNALDSAEQINQYFLAAFPTEFFSQSTVQDKEFMNDGIRVPPFPSGRKQGLGCHSGKIYPPFMPGK